MYDALLNLYCRVAAWLESEDGQGMAEYGLILALIAVVVIVALTFLGANIANKMNQVAGNLK